MPDFRGFTGGGRYSGRSAHCQLPDTHPERHCAPFAKPRATFSDQPCHVSRSVHHYAVRDQDIEVDFSQVTTPEDRIAIIAPEALIDNECGYRFGQASYSIFRTGRRCRRPLHWLPEACRGANA